MAEEDEGAIGADWAKGAEGAEGAMGSEAIMGAEEDKGAAIYLMLDAIISIFGEQSSTLLGLCLLSVCWESICGKCLLTFSKS